MACRGPWPAFRLTGGVLPAVPDWGDVGPFETVVVKHPYLYCWRDGYRLWAGATRTGATVYVCMHCKAVADVRRIA